MCEAAIEQELAHFTPKVDLDDHPLPPRHNPRRSKNQPQHDPRQLQRQAKKLGVKVVIEPASEGAECPC
jgi:hypothetical protein